MPTPVPQTQPSPPMGLGERCGVALSAGGLTAALYATFDAWAHAPELALGDYLVAMAFAAAPAILLVSALAGVLELGDRLGRLRLSRPRWCGLLAGMNVIGLCAAVVCLGVKSLHGWSALLAMLAAFPVAGLVYAGVVTSRAFECPWQQVALLLAALHALLASLVIDSAAASSGLPHFLITSMKVAVLALLSWSVHRLKHRAGRMTWAFMASLAIIVVGLGWFTRADTPHARTVAASREGPPNVVLIVLDTTRRDHLGCYGDSRGLTPELDRLAAGSVVYEDAFSPAPWTVPSHASLFTGLYPATHGCSYEHRLWLDDAFVTLAETLKEQGYQTVALNSNFYLRRCNLLQGFEKTFRLRGPYDDLTVHGLAQGLGMPERWTDKGASEAVALLGKWLGDGFDPARPFFLFVNLLEAHEKYLPPWAERRAGLPSGVSYAVASRLANGFGLHTANARHDDDAEARRVLKAMYAAEVKYQDRRLAELLGLLQSGTDVANTLIVVTADHGENLGEGGRWEHLYDVNDALIGVPLIIRYPGAAAGGTRLRGLCQTVDIMPTILQVAGISDGPAAPARHSLVPEKFAPRQEVVADVAPFYPNLSWLELQLGFTSRVWELRTHRYALRTADYKFVQLSNGMRHLFDVRQDPEELNNLVEQEPQIAAALAERLADRRAKEPAYVPASAAGGEPGYAAEETTERLRALGYVR
ncbi:MAG: sulfatase [Planctomycetes bacterium]|nr:sulfatase [Planctomycetota bacterium]